MQPFFKNGKTECSKQHSGSKLLQLSQFHPKHHPISRCRSLWKAQHLYQNCAGKARTPGNPGTCNGNHGFKAASRFSSFKNPSRGQDASKSRRKKAKVSQSVCETCRFCEWQGDVWLEFIFVALSVFSPNSVVTLGVLTVGVKSRGG